MAHTFTREQLYDLVWSEPMRTLAEKYEISDVGLAKACGLANIPVPPRGYWAKKSASKPVHRIPLPPRDPGRGSKVKIGQERSFYRERYDENTPLPAEPEFDEPIESVRARVEKAVGKVRVSLTFDLAHPTMRMLLARDERRREESRQRGWSVRTPVLDNPLHARRLRILNAVFLALAGQRCKGSVRGDAAEDIAVEIGDTRLSIKIEPIVERSRTRSTTEPGLRKERLRLSVVGRHEKDFISLAEDEPGKPIEQQLRKTVIELIVLGEIRYRENCLSHFKWQLDLREYDIAEARKQREEAARKERERIAALEKARVDNLLAEAVVLQKARDIRKYVDDVRNACALDGAIPVEKIESWAAWALAQADRIDPVISQRFLKSFESLTEAADPYPRQL